MAFGLSDQGFNAPRTADFLDLVRDEYEALTKLTIDWERDVFLGQISAIVASRLGELADMVQAMYDSLDPSSATGVQLDNLSVLVGVFRQPSTFSTVNLVLSGVLGTAIPAGRQVEGGGEDGAARWVTTTDGTTIAVALTTGDLTFTDNGANPATIDRASGSWIVDGVGVGTRLTIAGSVSNNGEVQVTRVVDSDTVEILGSATTEGPVSATATGNFVTVSARASSRGEVTAASEEIDTIVTPITGWHSVTNPVAASPGDDLETDSELRARRQASLQITGAASINAIRANLLALSQLSAAVVIENDTLTTTVVAGKTLNPKSFLVAVWPNTLSTADQQVVAETIYKLAPAGIEIMGTDVTANVTGADGFTKVVPFDYATTLNVDVVTTVVLDTGYTLALVQDAVETVVEDYFDALTVGDAVRALALGALVANVAGIVGATFTFNGGSADIVPLVTQIATLGSNTVTT